MRNKNHSITTSPEWRERSSQWKVKVEQNREESKELAIRQLLFEAHE